MPTSTFLGLPAAKQERVLTAASKEFAQRHAEQANIANIVRDAGISRGSFYQYFDSKEDLYVYIFETYRARRSEYTRSAFEYYKTEPFLTFFEHFYLLDSEFLLRHPLHIEMGKVMYAHAGGVSGGLIRAVQQRYRDIFLIAITHDQDVGRMRPDVDARLLADLCVHFMTDVFVFQNLMERLSIAAVKQHMLGTLDIMRRGIEMPSVAGPCLLIGSRDEHGLGGMDGKAEDRPDSGPIGACATTQPGARSRAAQ